MPTKFEERMGVCWNTRNGFRFGVVMSVGDDGSIDVARAMYLNEGTKCYDDGGADYRNDRHNVRLDDCPPPFAYVCLWSDTHKCFALADPNCVVHLTRDDVLVRGVEIIDGGSKISDKDFAAIKDHPWRDEKEHGKSTVNMDQLSKMLADMDATPQNMGNGGPQFGS